MSHIKLSPVIPFILILSIYSIEGLASAWDWLEQSPVSYFTPEDKKIMRRTAQDALENSKDGVRILWENPTTGHSGSVMSINKIKRNDLTCRKMKFSNKAKGLTSIQVHLLCKQVDGSWKIFN